MHRVGTGQDYGTLNTGDTDGIFQVIRSESWKLAGCGLGHGALSCALFLAHYAASSDQLDGIVTEIRELFDRGCNSVMSGKTGWLDFADLALITQKLSGLEIIDIEHAHFFEDIDKLALNTMVRPAHALGFNSDLGAGLYALRRHHAGAAGFCESIGRFVASSAAGALASTAFSDRALRNLRQGLSALVLLASVAAEMNLVDTGDSSVAGLIETFCESAPTTTPDHRGFQTGDLGTGYALLRAGMAFQHVECITAGMQLLIDCARSVLDCGIDSLDIASGSAGIGLAFNRIHHLTGHGIFQQVAAKAKWLSLNARILIDNCNIDRGYSFYNGLSGIGLSTLHWQNGQPEQLDELVWLI